MGLRETLTPVGAREPGEDPQNRCRLHKPRPGWLTMSTANTHMHHRAQVFGDQIELLTEPLFRDVRLMIGFGLRNNQGDMVKYSITL